MIDFYKDVHKVWARSHRAGSPIKYVRNTLLIKALKKLTPGFTLDAGCGTGAYSIFLAERGHTVKAFDASPFAIRKLREYSGKGVNIQAEINTVENFYSSEQFDNILAIEVMEHIVSDRSAIKKYYSLLKAGGTMVISVPATPFLYSLSDQFSGHYRRYSYKNFRSLITSAGFKHFQITRYGFPVLFLYSLIRKLFLDKLFIRHFLLTKGSADDHGTLFSRLYPLLLAIDLSDKSFFSVGYVAVCQK
ncbi:MAG: class I SAM-dependent methyltransferase [Candidatus Magnetomorum sp.]|nr:class I SAM-dependent methyltransferase [Candidatus Magnetomorum sp.]